MFYKVFEGASVIIPYYEGYVVGEGFGYGGFQDSFEVLFGHYFTLRAALWRSPASLRGSMFTLTP